MTHQINKALEEADIVVTGRNDFADTDVNIFNAKTLDSITEDKVITQIIYALAPNLIAVTGLLAETIKVLKKIKPYFDEGTDEEEAIRKLIANYTELDDV